MNGFIEIYNIKRDKLELSISFQAHRDIISKIIQLKQSGFLLTSSYDNSVKIFELTNNCTKEKLNYIIYLNDIFTRINEVIEITFNNNLILSVNNYMINFPLNKNKLLDNKNKLSDYNYSKYEHQRKYLNNLLEINNDDIACLDSKESQLLIFKIIYNKEIADDITLIKIIDLEKNNEIKNYESKISIECLRPKYNCILVSDKFFIKIIDIKYLEIVSIFQIKNTSKYMNQCVTFYHKLMDKIFIFDSIAIYKYKINSENIFEFIKEEEKNANINNIINLNELQKLIYCPINKNKIYAIYKKFLTTIDLNKFFQ